MQTIRGILPLAAGSERGDANRLSVQGRPLQQAARLVRAFLVSRVAPSNAALRLRGGPPRGGKLHGGKQRD